MSLVCVWKNIYACRNIYIYVCMYVYLSSQGQKGLSGRHISGSFSIYGTVSETIETPLKDHLVSLNRMTPI